MPALRSTRHWKSTRHDHDLDISFARRTGQETLSDPERTKRRLIEQVVRASFEDAMATGYVPMTQTPRFGEVTEGRR